MLSWWSAASSLCVGLTLTLTLRLTLPLIRPNANPDANSNPHPHQVEYSLEPHIVLRVDQDTGDCVPLFGETSNAGLAALQASVGRVSGGAPPLLLASRGVYVGN